MKNYFEIIRKDPFDAFMKGMFIVAFGGCAWLLSRLYQEPVFAAMWDSIALGILPCCIIYLWRSFKRKAMNLPENLKEKKSERYFMLFLITVLVFFCLARADITEGFSNYDFDVKPNGVWKAAGFIGLISGIPTFIMSWLKNRRLKKQEVEEKKQEGHLC